MKRLATYLLLLLPCIAFGQLFPTVPDFKGNIKKVVEKRYGIEVDYNNIFKGIFRPEVYTGWEYYYMFDTNANLVSRTSTFYEKLKADYLYQRDSIENRIIEREITADQTAGHEGDYLEYENFTDSSGRIVKVNYWWFDAKECTRELFQLENNAKYREGKLIEFIRRNIKTNGDTAIGEKCTLHYDSSGNLIRIERNDMATGLKTILDYTYNDQGSVDHFSVDYLVGLDKYGENKKQEIYYKYDKQGNWIRKYWNTGSRNRLEAKRKYIYYDPNLNEETEF